jgi:hypothetical protein
MEIYEIVLLVFVSFIFFDFASRSRMFARILAALWSFGWLILFYKKIRSFELEIPSEWFWKITSGKSAMNFGENSLFLLLFWLIFPPTSIWFFTIPISGIVGLCLHIYKAAREIGWRDLAKVYKFGKRSEILKEKLYEK